MSEIGRGFAWRIALFVLPLLGCGGVVESASGSDATDAPIKPLPGAKVFMAFDAKGSMPTSTLFIDTPKAFCIVTLPSAMPGVSATFSITDRSGSGSVYASGKQTLGAGQTEAHYELPHVNPFAPGKGTREPYGPCLGYGNENGTGCARGYADEGTDGIGAGVTCCFNPFSPSAFPYPEGEFACTVDIGSEQAGVAGFQVDYPPSVDGQVCPREMQFDGGPPFPYPRALCAGWVPNGAMCMGCTCMGDFWSCLVK
jgi:hypothetical protein